MESWPMSCRFPEANRRLLKIPAYSFGERPLMTPSFINCSAVGNSPCEIEVSESDFTNRMFIMGMGYVGKFFGRDLKNRGWCVSGTCTSREKKRELEEIGFDVHLFNANEPQLDVLNILNHHTHLLVTIPPLIGLGDPMLLHEELLKSVLVNGNLRWLGYLSSTSVYGDRAGAWIDEDYAVIPRDAKAKARVASEEGWLKLSHDLGIESQIFRLGGIYGPGRSAVDTLIKKGALSNTQRLRASKSYTSRIHVADICQALWASISKASQRVGPIGGQRRSRTKKIYNVVDDDPAPRFEVFSYARDLVERKWPGHLEQASQPPLPSERGLGGEKRVSNACLKKELGVRLLHPNYRSGLTAIVDHMDNPFL